MKKIIGFLFLALLPLSTAHSFQLDIKGFIALDMFNLEKVERQKQTAELGIGVMDLKIFARHEDISLKVKMDIDGDLSTRNNLFEEALIYYRIDKNWRVTFGKGKVPFHQMHWGVSINSYVDGGSIIGTNSSFRDFDRKVMASLRYGQYNRGFFNHFTIFGDSIQPRRDRDTGEPCFDNGCRATFPSTYDSGLNSRDTQFQTSNERTFSLKYEQGVANRVEYFYSRDLQFALGGLWYRKQEDPHPTYIGSLSTRFRNYQWEMWGEFTYGRYSRTRFLRFGADKQFEKWLQLGAEYRYTRKVSFLANVEGQHVKKRDNLDDINSTSRFNTGVTEGWDTYKAEVGVKYYLSNMAFFTFGTTFETQEYTISQADLNYLKSRINNYEGEFESTHAWGFKTGFSFWF